MAGEMTAVVNQDALLRIAIQYDRMAEEVDRVARATHKRR